MYIYTIIAKTKICSACGANKKNTKTKINVYNSSYVYLHNNRKLIF